MADAETPLTILYFAWLREKTGTSEETLTPPARVRTVDDLMGWLAERSPGHTIAFSNRRVVRCAVNQNFAEPATFLHPGDEVAFFPPVTGG
jgi:molybdopterin converting factor subunit 1